MHYHKTHDTYCWVKIDFIASNIKYHSHYQVRKADLSDVPYSSFNSIQNIPEKHPSLFLIKAYSVSGFLTNIVSHLFWSCYLVTDHVTPPSIHLTSHLNLETQICQILAGTERLSILMLIITSTSSSSSTGPRFRIKPMAIVSQWNKITASFQMFF